MNDPIAQIIDSRRTARNCAWILQDDYSRQLYAPHLTRLAEIQRDSETFRARLIARLTPRQLLDALRDRVLTPAEYSAAMSALCAARGLVTP